jgi:hypothetical protein
LINPLSGGQNMAEFLKPADLNMISAEVELEAQKAEMAKRLQAGQAEESVRQAFESRQLAPEAPERINKAVRDAAERGEHEVLVLRFPSTFCKDGGRRINNFEHDWPDSLQGFGRTAFDFYEKELRPLGFTLRAEILNFPGGMPGDVGMYLRW